MPASAVPQAADPDKLREDVNNFLTLGQISSVSVDDGDNEATMSITIRKQTAAPPEAAPEPPGVLPVDEPVPVAAHKMRRLTKEAASGLANRYPREFLVAMGLVQED